MKTLAIQTTDKTLILFLLAFLLTLTITTTNAKPAPQTTRGMIALIVQGKNHTKTVYKDRINWNPKADTRKGRKFTWV